MAISPKEIQTLDSEKINDLNAIDQHIDSVILEWYPRIVQSMWTMHVPLGRSIPAKFVFSLKELDQLAQNKLTHPFYDMLIKRLKRNGWNAKLQEIQTGENSSETFLILTANLDR